MKFLTLVSALFVSTAFADDQEVFRCEDLHSLARSNTASLMLKKVEKFPRREDVNDPICGLSVAPFIRQNSVASIHHRRLHLDRIQPHTSTDLSYINETEDVVVATKFLLEHLAKTNCFTVPATEAIAALHAGYDSKKYAEEFIHDCESAFATLEADNSIHNFFEPETVIRNMEKVMEEMNEKYWEEKKKKDAQDAMEADEERKKDREENPLPPNKNAKRDNRRRERRENKQEAARQYQDYIEDSYNHDNINDDIVPSPTNTVSFPVWAIVLIAVGGVVLGAGVTAAIMAKKKKQNNSPAEESLIESSA